MQHLASGRIHGIALLIDTGTAVAPLVSALSNRRLILPAHPQ